MSSQHLRAKDLFLEALEHPPADRAAFVEHACAADTALREEVESLLAFHDSQDDLLVEDERPDATFAPGQTLAGRYRMIARLGRGGMGDVWQADDTVLGTAVAVKLITNAGAASRDRLRNEVRLARQITHPNVCRVFDFGESEGYVFFTMELVRGEDLASLLRRVGRLPSEKVVDVARQLCQGLAAAHASGVLHRDLKPANVLIDDEGLVRISDFGIAIPNTEVGRHMNTGTPGYMAPEQRMPSSTLSERTDVYSLGLVLYELVTGQHAMSGRDATSPPASPSSLVPNVNPRLERVIMQSLSLNPADRPASAAAIAAALPDAGNEMPGSRPSGPRTRGGRAPGSTWWIAASFLAGVIGILAVSATFFGTPGANTLTERDVIMLADFENTTGESVFDGTLKVALAVALEQSPFLKVFPDARARETLRLMERPPDQAIDRAVAREIARRERLKALIAGSVVSLGSHYVLSLEAINAETGEAMAREQAEASSKEDVLGVIGSAASRLRRRLGESLASVQRFDVELPRATTSSLDALHAYALALDEGRAVPRIESIPHLKRAIEIDPTFAMAHAALSGVYANTGQTGLAPEYSRLAFSLRDRVSERERFFISWRYYRDAAQNWDRALELARAWTATYPREAFAFNARGAALIRLGHFEESTEPLLKSIELDSKFSPAYANLAASYLALNRPADARSTLDLAASRGIDYAGVHRLAYFIGFAQRDQELMARELAASVGVGDTNAAFGWQAHASASAGREREAHDYFRRGIQMSLQGRFQEIASHLAAEDAESHAVMGQCETALAEVPYSLELSRDNLTLERAARVFGLCGEAEPVARLTTELKTRFPEANLTVGASVPIAEAALALSRNDAAAAIRVLDPVKPYERAPYTEYWATYLRGVAHLRLKDGSAAATQFQSILDRGGEVPAATLFPLAHLGRAQAATLEGDTDTARHFYGTFLDLWKDADPDLKALKQAQAESAQLR